MNGPGHSEHIKTLDPSDPREVACMRLLTEKELTSMESMKDHVFANKLKDKENEQSRYKLELCSRSGDKYRECHQKFMCDKAHGYYELLYFRSKTQCPLVQEGLCKNYKTCDYSHDGRFPHWFRRLLLRRRKEFHAQQRREEELASRRQEGSSLPGNDASNTPTAGDVSAAEAAGSGAWMGSDPDSPPGHGVDRAPITDSPRESNRDSNRESNHEYVRGTKPSSTRERNWVVDRTPSREHREELGGDALKRPPDGPQATERDDDGAWPSREGHLKLPAASAAPGSPSKNPALSPSSPIARGHDPYLDDGPSPRRRPLPSHRDSRTQEVGHTARHEGHHDEYESYSDRREGRSEASSYKRARAEQARPRPDRERKDPGYHESRERVSARGSALDNSRSADQPSHELRDPRAGALRKDPIPPGASAAVDATGSKVDEGGRRESRFSTRPRESQSESGATSVGPSGIRFPGIPDSGGESEIDPYAPRSVAVGNEDVWRSAPISPAVPSRTPAGSSRLALDVERVRIDAVRSQREAEQPLRPGLAPVGPGAGVEGNSGRALNGRSAPDVSGMVESSGAHDAVNPYRSRSVVHDSSRNQEPSSGSKTTVEFWRDYRASASTWSSDDEYIFNKICDMFLNSHKRDHVVGGFHLAEVFGRMEQEPTHDGHFRISSSSLLSPATLVRNAEEQKAVAEYERLVASILDDLIEMRETENSET